MANRIIPMNTIMVVFSPIRTPDVTPQKSQFFPHPLPSLNPSKYINLYSELLSFKSLYRFGVAGGRNPHITSMDFETCEKPLPRG